MLNPISTNQRPQISHPKPLQKIETFPQTLMPPSSSSQRPLDLDPKILPLPACSAMSATWTLVSFITAFLAELSGAALGFGPAILYAAWNFSAGT